MLLYGVEPLEEAYIKIEAEVSTKMFKAKHQSDRIRGKLCYPCPPIMQGISKKLGRYPQFGLELVEIDRYVANWGFMSSIEIPTVNTCRSGGERHIFSSPLGLLSFLLSMETSTNHQNMPK